MNGLQKTCMAQMTTPYDHVRNWRHPAKLFLEVTTRCNLQCKMCVKQSSGCGIASGDLDVSTFKALLPSLTRIDTVILSGVGEPLLHPMLTTFISEIKTALPPSGTVGLQTNGTLLTRPRIDQLAGAGLDAICLSIDAVQPGLLDTLRTGAKIGQLEWALKHLNDVKRRCRDSSLKVGIQFVMMQGNLHQLPKVLRWAGRLGIDFAIVSHLYAYDPDLSRQVAYMSNSDAATALFQDWREKAARYGLRIEDYPAASVKYYKCRSADDRKLIDLVSAMKAHAYDRNISLHLPSLMGIDENRQSTMDAIFAEATSVADHWGINLILPARQPTHERQCSFMEEGSVFVAWDGAVSPCHFTWHPYASYPDGRKKIVPSVSFGNVEAMPLGDIWHASEFKAFRNDALRYAYPYCGDCGVSPCDAIDGPQFEHDCYAFGVPCCDCPWSVGLLNCLADG